MTVEIVFYKCPILNNTFGMDKEIQIATSEALVEFLIEDNNSKPTNIICANLYYS